MKKGYTTVYNQCSQEVHNKLKATKYWENVQLDQSLHEPIKRIEKICIGFDDRKQSAFNLVQSLKTLFLYIQTEIEVPVSEAAAQRILELAADGVIEAAGEMAALTRAQVLTAVAALPAETAQEAALRG